MVGPVVDTAQLSRGAAGAGQPPGVLQICSTLSFPTSLKTYRAKCQLETPLQLARAAG